MTPLRSIASLALPETTRLVYAAICELDGEATYTEIAELAGCSRRTAVYHVRALLDAGIIVRERSRASGRQGANRYSLPRIQGAARVQPGCNQGADGLHSGEAPGCSQGAARLHSGPGCNQGAKPGPTSLSEISLSPPMGPPLSHRAVEVPTPGDSSASPPPPDPRPHRMVESTEAGPGPLVAPSQLALDLGASVEATKRRAKGSAEPKRKSRCPSSIDPQAPAWLARWGIPALSSSNGAEVAKMLDQHTAKGNLFLDWLAVWRTWDRNADSFGKRAHGPAAGHRPRSEPTRAPAAPEERPALAPEANAAKAAALMRDLGNIFAMNRKPNGTVTR